MSVSSFFTNINCRLHLVKKLSGGLESFLLYPTYYVLADIQECNILKITIQNYLKFIAAFFDMHFYIDNK